MARKDDSGSKKKAPSSYSKAKLKEFEKQLTDQRNEILKGFDDQRAEIDGFRGDTESDTYDDASNIVELNILMTLSDGQKRELDQVTQALSKIKDGTYGVCEGCGQLIAEKRLKALPFTNLCVECKGREERGSVVLNRDSRIAPIDEDFLVNEDDDNA